MTSYGAIKARQLEYYNPTSGQTANPWREEIDQDNVYRMKRYNGSSYNTIMKIDPTNTNGAVTAPSEQTFLISSASGQTAPIMSVLDENSTTLLNVTTTVNTQNVIPRTDDTHSLGTDTVKFGTIYTDSLNFTSQSGSTTGTPYPAGSDITTHQALALYNDAGTTKAKPFEKIGLRGGVSTIAANISFAGVCSVSDSTILAVYQDVSDGNYVKVRLGTVLNKHIVYNDPVMVFAESLGECQIVKLDTNKALVVATNSGAVRSREITVSGDTLSMSSIVSPSIGTPSFMKLSAMSTSSALLTFKDSDNQFKGSVYTGSWGSAVVIKGTTVGDHPSSVVVSATQALAVYTVGNDLFVADVALPAITPVEKSGISSMGATGDFTDICIPTTDSLLAVVRVGSEARYITGTTADGYTNITFGNSGNLQSVDSTDVSTNLNLITVSDGNVLLMGSNTNYARGYIGNYAANAMTWGNQSSAMYSATNVYVTANFNTVTKLADNNFVAVGNQSGGTAEGWSRFGQLLGTNTTHWANEWELSNSTEDAKIIKIDDSTFMVAFKNSSNQLSVQAGTYINGVLTLGTEVTDAAVTVVSDGAADNHNVAATLITSTLAVIGYRVGTDYIMRTVSISGTALTLNTAVTVSTFSAADKGFDVLRVSDTEVVMFYSKDATPSASIYARLYNISGTTLTAAAAETAIITGVNVQWYIITMAPIPNVDRHWMMFALGGTRVYYWVFRPNNVEGSATVIEKLTLDGNTPTLTGLTYMGNAINIGNNVALTVQETAGNFFTFIFDYEIDDIRVGTSAVFDPSADGFQTTFPISNTSLGVIFWDGTQLKLRTFYVNNLTVTYTGNEYILDDAPNAATSTMWSVLLNPTTVLTTRGESFDSRNIIQAVYPRNDVYAGIAQTTVSAGANVGVKLIGERSTGHSGLAPGNRYYVADDAEITLENTGIVAGLATTSSEIFIRNN